MRVLKVEVVEDNKAQSQLARVKYGTQSQSYVCRLEGVENVYNY